MVESILVVCWCWCVWVGVFGFGLVCVFGVGVCVCVFGVWRVGIDVRVCRTSFARARVRGMSEARGTDMFAREGRDLQRYDEQGRRLLAGSVPWRLVEADAGRDGTLARGGMAKAGGGRRSERDEKGASWHVQVLLVTSRRGEGLVLPKGGWESDESVVEAAQRETWEEAGVLGDRFEPLGTFLYRNKLGKARPEVEEGPGSCLAHMYACHVVDVKEAWPEQDMRRRVWCDLERAMDVLKHEWMRQALLAWKERWEKHPPDPQTNGTPPAAKTCWKPPEGEGEEARTNGTNTSECT